MLHKSVQWKFTCFSFCNLLCSTQSHSADWWPIHSTQLVFSCLLSGDWLSPAFLSLLVWFWLFGPCYVRFCNFDLRPPTSFWDLKKSPKGLRQMSRASHFHSPLHLHMRSWTSRRATCYWKRPCFEDKGTARIQMVSREWSRLVPTE